MAKGLDTTFLIQAEVSEHPEHGASRDLLHRLLAEGDALSLAPQVLSEFVHIVTDPRRFERPLSMGQALSRAEHWWQATEVSQVFPSERSTSLFLRWMVEHRLGRKRLLDTQLAATYHAAGVACMVTTNARDFSIFGCFSILQP
jgi:predicted nucleic acid-binding protein